MSNFFKNFILCGDADHHCLLCQETFKSTSDVEKHIRWENHRKSLKSQTYFPKYKKDAIFKIGNYFYCEVCNYTTKDVAAVAIHISEDQHKKNKENPENAIKKVIGLYCSDDVILDTSIINVYQWQGIIGVNCVLCNTVIDSFRKHTTKQDHVISLIQTEIKCNNGDYYRMINKDKFQCFKCKSVYSTEDFEEHWSNENHCSDISKIESSKGDTKQTKEDKFVIDTPKNFFDFDAEHKTALCKVCKEIVKSDLKSIIEHVKIHADVNISFEIDLDQRHKTGIVSEGGKKVKYIVFQDHGKRRSELSKYGKENFIKLNAGGSKGYCNLCDKELSAHMKVFQQHINGAIHSGHMELKGLKESTEHNNKKYITMPLHRYIDSVIHLKDIRSFWINHAFTINYDSFMCLKKIEHGLHYKKVKCFACDEICPPGTEYDHCDTMEHQKKFMNINVIVSRDQFVREIRPYLYHCGFCNELFPFSENLEKHMGNLKHELNSKNAQGYSSSTPKDEINSTNNVILYALCMKYAFQK